MKRLALGAAWALGAMLASSQALAQPAAAAPAAGGIASSVIGLIEKACMPLIKGQDVKAVAQAAGLRRGRDDLVLQLPGVQKIVLSPPTTANPTVCSMEVDYDVGQTKALADALGAWAMSQDPPIPVLAAASTPAPGVTSWSWAVDTGQIQEGLVFSSRQTPDGKPAGGNHEIGAVLFSRHGG